MTQHEALGTGRCARSRRQAWWSRGPAPPSRYPLSALVETLHGAGSVSTQATLATTLGPPRPASWLVERDLCGYRGARLTTKPEVTEDTAGAWTRLPDPSAPHDALREAQAPQTPHQSLTGELVPGSQPRGPGRGLVANSRGLVAADSSPPYGLPGSLPVPGG